MDDCRRVGWGIEIEMASNLSWMKIDLNYMSWFPVQNQPCHVDTSTIVIPSKMVRSLVQEKFIRMHGFCICSRKKLIPTLY